MTITIQTRYENRFDAYEWLAMCGQRTVANGYHGKSHNAARDYGYRWLKYVTICGKIPS